MLCIPVKKLWLIFNIKQNVIGILLKYELSLKLQYFSTVEYIITILIHECCRDSCKAQVHGYGGARYKKFNSPEEAQAFVNGQDSGGFSNYTSGGQSSYKYSWDSAQSYSSCYSNETPQHSSHYSYQHQKKYTSGHRSSPYTCSSRQYSSSSTSSGSLLLNSSNSYVV